MADPNESDHEISLLFPLLPSTPVENFCYITHNRLCKSYRNFRIPKLKNWLRVPIPMAMELQVLKRDFEALKVLAENQEQRLRYYESRANYMTMGYLMWQRFFYFAVSHPSSALECVHWWMVLGLSLSSSFVYFLIFLEAVIMLYWTHNLLDIICKEQTNICQRISEAINQGDGGSSMEAGDSSDGFGVNFSFQVRALNYDSFRIVERKVYICAIAFALFAVTAFELYACKYLLCH